jgi:hypothetical protein
MKMIPFYIATLCKALRARNRGDDALEDSLLEQLDSIWVQLSPRELFIVDELTKRLSLQLISLADLEYHSFFSSEYALPASSSPRWLALKKIYHSSSFENRFSTQFLGSMPEQQRSQSLDEKSVILSRCHFVTV